MKYTIATDGSFHDDLCWGAAIIRNEDTGDEHMVNAYTDLPFLYEAKNVGGEILGCLIGINTLAQIMKEAKDFEPEITILHDYNGIGNWAIGRWKTNKESSRFYVKGLQYYLKHLPIKSIEFEHVQGHTGDRLNEMADHYCSMDVSKAVSAAKFIVQLIKETEKDE